MEHIVMHTRLNLKLKLDLYSSTLNTKLFNSNVYRTNKMAYIAK